MMENSKDYTLNLTIGQIRILRIALEKYIRNHEIILHNNQFDVNAMRLLFADLSRYCDLCKMLNDILLTHDSKSSTEDK